MSLGARRAKDTAMASMLKEQGVKRTTMKCPICYQLVGIDRFPGHVMTNCNKGKQ